MSSIALPTGHYPASPVAPSPNCSPFPPRGPSGLLKAWSREGFSLPDTPQRLPAASPLRCKLHGWPQGQGRPPVTPACLSDLISLPLLCGLPAPQTHRGLSVLWALETAVPLVPNLQKAPHFPARMVSCIASLYPITLLSLVLGVSPSDTVFLMCPCACLGLAPSLEEAPRGWEVSSSLQDPQL